VVSNLITTHELHVIEGEPQMDPQRVKRMLERIRRLEMAIDQDAHKPERKRMGAQHLEGLQREAMRLRLNLGLNPTTRLTDEPGPGEPGPGPAEAAENGAPTGTAVE
jgi:hypothetical protein